MIRYTVRGIIRHVCPDWILIHDDIEIYRIYGAGAWRQRIRIDQGVGNRREIARVIVD